MAYTPKLTYKGRPLVRCGNDIYYGSMKDPFVVYLQVSRPRRKTVSTWPTRSTSCCFPPTRASPCPSALPASNKVGLYNALSFGDIMLQGALQKSKKWLNQKTACLRIWETGSF